MIMILFVDYHRLMIYLIWGVTFFTGGGWWKLVTSPTATLTPKRSVVFSAIFGLQAKKWDGELNQSISIILKWLWYTLIYFNTLQNFETTNTVFPQAWGILAPISSNFKSFETEADCNMWRFRLDENTRGSTPTGFRPIPEVIPGWGTVTKLWSGN